MQWADIKPKTGKQSISTDISKRNNAFMPFTNTVLLCSRFFDAFTFFIAIRILAFYDCFSLKKLLGFFCQAFFCIAVTSLHLQLRRCYHLLTCTCLYHNFKVISNTTFPHFSDALTITYDNQNCSIFVSIILLGFCLKNTLLCTAITTFVQYMLNLY